MRRVGDRPRVAGRTHTGSREWLRESNSRRHWPRSTSTSSPPWSSEPTRIPAWPESSVASASRPRRAARTRCSFGSAITGAGVPRADAAASRPPARHRPPTSTLPWAASVFSDRAVSGGGSRLVQVRAGVLAVSRVREQSTSADGREERVTAHARVHRPGGAQTSTTLRSRSDRRAFVVSSRRRIGDGRGRPDADRGSEQFVRPALETGGGPGRLRGRRCRCYTALGRAAPSRTR